MAQAHSHLSASHLSVEQIAGAINGMIAERAAERLREVPCSRARRRPRRQRHSSRARPASTSASPAADYHATPPSGRPTSSACSCTRPATGSTRHMNPDRRADSDSPAKQKGRALHKLVLEGEGFGRSSRSRSPAAYPGCLVTLDDLKAKCRDLGEPVSGTKAELAKRIKAKAPNAIIFDDILGLFRAMVERDGLEVLKPDAMREVRAAAASITLNPHLARAFQGGIPRYRSSGSTSTASPASAALDWLKPRTIVDIKKCANVRERPFDSGDAGDRRVPLRHLGQALPRRLRLPLRVRAREGRVFGDCPLKPGWGGASCRPRRCVCTWVFHQTEGAPVTNGREIRPELAGAQSRRARDRPGQARSIAQCLAEVRHRTVGLRRADRRAGRHRSAGVDA